MSKIQFESKSQLVTAVFQYSARCLSVCQRYNLKANHNTYKIHLFYNFGVYQCVKDTIWKQITTTKSILLIVGAVFISVSKIQFESKSQLYFDFVKFLPGCLSVCQRYNLKANHNILLKMSRFVIGVYQCVKDTIWKQITTLIQTNNAQHVVFISVSKIQFESKSQLIHCNSVWTCGVYQCVKDTIWKQITTVTSHSRLKRLVFISVSKIQFESKSQQINTYM